MSLGFFQRSSLPSWCGRLAEGKCSSLSSRRLSIVTYKDEVAQRFFSDQELGTPTSHVPADVSGPVLGTE